MTGKIRIFGNMIIKKRQFFKKISLLEGNNI